MINKNVLFLFGVLIIAVNSAYCQVNYFADEGTTNLSLAENQDLKLAALRSTKERAYLIGYSPFKHIAIKAGYNEIEKNTTLFDAKGTNLSLSLGTYFSPTKTKENDESQTGEFLMFLNGGYGFGQVGNTWEGANSNFKNHKFFVDLGFKRKWEYFVFGLNFKHSWITYREGVINGRLNSEIEKTIDQLDFTTRYTTLEFYFVVGLTTRYFDFILGLPINVGSNSSIIQPALLRSNFVGLIFNVEQIYKKKS